MPGVVPSRFFPSRACFTLGVCFFPVGECLGSAQLLSSSRRRILGPHLLAMGARTGESPAFCAAASSRGEYGNQEGPGFSHRGVRQDSLSSGETCARARLRLRICGHLSRGPHAVGTRQLRFAIESSKAGRQQHASSHEVVARPLFHGVLLSGSRRRLLVAAGHFPRSNVFRAERTPPQRVHPCPRQGH